MCEQEIQTDISQVPGMNVFVGEPEEPNNIIVRLFHTEMGEVFYHQGLEDFYYIERIKTSEEVDEGIKSLVDILEREFEDKYTAIFTVGKGGKIFSDKLQNEMFSPKRNLKNKDIVREFIPASSYSGQNQEGINMNGYKFKKETIEGKNILLVDGVYDTGTTFNNIVDSLVEHNPLSISSCLLMSKLPEESSVTTTPERKGIDKEFCIFYINKDDWVCGEGPDFDQWHREITGGGIGRVIWLGKNPELIELLSETSGI